VSGLCQGVPRDAQAPRQVIRARPLQCRAEPAVAANRFSGPDTGGPELVAMQGRTSRCSKRGRQPGDPISGHQVIDPNPATATEADARRS
jgi:hypothetical protein